MTLNTRALAITSALLWGGAVFLVGLANLIWPPYGNGFLEMIASVYPGYDAESSLSGVIVGTLYGLVDGLLGGLVFGWLYNRIAEIDVSRARAH